MQPDPAAGLGEPSLHQFGMLVAGIVEIDMDQRQQRIEGVDGFEQFDGRKGIDGLDLDHPVLPGFEIDGAVDVDAASVRWLVGWPDGNGAAPSSPRPVASMGRMHRAGKQHGLVRPHPAPWN